MGKTRTLTDDLAKLDGKPPYDVPSNTAAHDPYFALDIERYWGAPLAELRKKAEGGKPKVQGRF